MNGELLQTLVRKEGGHIELGSPEVGFYRDAPPKGRLVRVGDVVGRIETLGKLTTVTAAAEGIVTAVHADGLARRPVGYGDALLTLDPEVLASSHTEGASATVDSTGELVFAAPMSGRVYLRPAPDKEPFVGPGTLLTAGSTVALLEVMKTFNRVAYASAGGLPPKAKVVRVLVADGADVAKGDPLVELEEG